MGWLPSVDPTFYEDAPNKDRRRQKVGHHVSESGWARHLASIQSPHQPTFTPGELTHPVPVTPFQATLARAHAERRAKFFAPAQAKKAPPVVTTSTPPRFRPGTYKPFSIPEWRKPTVVQIAVFPPIVAIQRAVALVFGVSVAAQRGPCRLRKIVRARQAAIFIADSHKHWSLQQIGGAFGDRDHTTIIHAVRTIEALLLTDADLAARVAEVRELMALGAAA